MIVVGDRAFAADAGPRRDVAIHVVHARRRRRPVRIRLPHQADEVTTMQDDNNPAASTAQDIKAAARDMLRMGSRWAHSALDWIDERRHEMNHRNRPAIGR